MIHYYANFITAIIWGGAHLPFIMSFVLGAAALSKLVVAHDCPNADLHDLTEHWMERSDEEVPYGLRWFYCGGLGLALFFMGMSFLSLPSFVTSPLPQTQT